MKQDNRCLDYRLAVKESEQQLLSLERSQRYALLHRRMRFLRLLKSGACGSQAQAGRQIGLGLRGAEKLWKKYRSEGLEGLLRYPYRGTRGKLSEDQQQHLQAELRQDSTQHLQQACDFVERSFGVRYSPAGMHFVFKRLQIKKKTARPTHSHRDEQGARRFKKKE